MKVVGMLVFCSQTGYGVPPPPRRGAGVSLFGETEQPENVDWFTEKGFRTCVCIKYKMYQLRNLMATNSYKSMCARCAIKAFHVRHDKAA